MHNPVTAPIPIWMIQNSSEVPTRIKKINRTHLGLTSMQEVWLETYDVKTLYTNIPHEDLMQQFKKLFDNILTLNGHRELRIGRRGKVYSIVFGNQVDFGKSKYDQLYTLEEVLNMIDFLVKNTYITLADKQYHQLIGIPMGTNAGVNIVDFYLMNTNWIL